MPLDDVTLRALQQGAAGIRQAAQDIQITRTITQANDLVQQVRASELSDAQKREQMAQISQQAVFNLTQAGSTPQAIKAVADAIDPQETIQSLTQGLFSRDPSTRKRAKELVDLEFEREMSLASIKKGSAFTHSDIRNLHNDFINDKVNVASREALEGISTARASLGTLTAQGLNAAITQVAKAAGEDRLTNEDIDRFRPGQAISSKMKAAWSRLISGTSTGEDRETMELLLQAQERKLKSSLRKRASGYSRAVGSQHGLDPTTIMNQILVRTGLPPQQSLRDRLRPTTIIVNGKPVQGYVDPLNPDKTYMTNSILGGDE